MTIAKRYSSECGAAGQNVLQAVLVVGVFILMCGVLLLVVVKKNKTPPPVTAEQQADTKSRPLPTVVPMVEVLVPLEEIKLGEPLVPQKFTRVFRPAAGLPSNVIRSIDEIQGKFARSIIPALEPFISSMVSRTQPVNIVADTIPNGFRAVTINVNATSGVEGWASPGAVVDVNWIAERQGEKMLILLVQNAKVLSAERQVDPAMASPDPGKPIPTTVTLLVSERDAQKISLAASAGVLFLHLRGEDEGRASTAPSGISLSEVITGKRVGKEKIEGTIKVKRADGTYDELAIVNGRIMTRVE